MDGHTDGWMGFALLRILREECEQTRRNEMAKGALHASLHRRTPASKVEAPSSEPNVVRQPSHPLLESLPQLGVGVVQVGRRTVVVACVRVASAAKDGVVACDGPLAPVDAVAAVADVVAVRVVLPVGALFVCTTVVDDNVCHRRHTRCVQGHRQQLEVLIRAVL